jgi:hypothetical protein
MTTGERQNGASCTIEFICKKLSIFQFICLYNDTLVLQMDVVGVGRKVRA